MSDINLSTNEIMFDCQVDLLNGSPNADTAAKVSNYIQKYFTYDGDEGLAQENFSSDNWETVYQWRKVFVRNGVQDLPLFGHHSRNPFDFIFFLWLKYPFIGFIFYPLMCADIFIGACKPYTYNHKKWVRDTSGKKKAFFKMLTLKMGIMFKVTTWINSKSDYYKSWLNIFSIYHQPDHRVHIAFVNWENKHSA